MKLAHLFATTISGQVEIGTLALDRGKIVVLKDSIASQNMLEEAAEETDVEKWFDDLPRRYDGSYFRVAVDNKQLGTLPQGV